MNASFYKKAVGCAVVVSTIFSASLVFAQTAQPNAQLVISWHAADSYVPPGYFAKTLPNSSSPITASVEVFSKSGIANLKSNTIYWYLDDQLIGGGPGAQSITFSPFGNVDNSESLQVQIPDYPGGLLIKTISIPIMQPMVVVGGPFVNGFFSNNPLSLTALPYFFDVTSSDALSFTWAVNGVTGTNTENPKQLQINLPSGTPSGSSFIVSLAATNAVDSTTATVQKTLTYQPLP